MQFSPLSQRVVGRTRVRSVVFGRERKVTEGRRRRTLCSADDDGGINNKGTAMGKQLPTQFALTGFAAAGGAGSTTLLADDLRSRGKAACVYPKRKINHKFFLP